MGGIHAGAGNMDAVAVGGDMHGSGTEMPPPNPAWIVVMVLGVIGVLLLMAGLMLFICRGGRKRSTRTCTRTSGESELIPEQKGAEVPQRSMDSQPEPETPLLHPLPPLLPLVAPVVSFPSASFPTVSAVVSAVPASRYAAVPPTGPTGGAGVLSF